MNSEQVLEEIKKLVSSFEEEKEKAESKIKKIEAQIAVSKGQKLNDLYCTLSWAESRKATLETVILLLKLKLSSLN